MHGCRVVQVRVSFTSEGDMKDNRSTIPHVDRPQLFENIFGFMRIAWASTECRYRRHKILTPTWSVLLKIVAAMAALPLHCARHFAKRSGGGGHCRRRRAARL